MICFVSLFSREFYVTNEPIELHWTVGTVYYLNKLKLHNQLCVLSFKQEYNTFHSKENNDFNTFNSRSNLKDT